MILFLPVWNLYNLYSVKSFSRWWILTRTFVWDCWPIPKDKIKFEHSAFFIFPCCSNVYSFFFSQKFWKNFMVTTRFKIYCNAVISSCKKVKIMFRVWRKCNQFLPSELHYWTFLHREIPGFMSYLKKKAGEKSSNL